MTWDPNKYVKLLLNREEGKQDKWLMALRTTADYYGWTQEFPTWTLRPFVQGTKYTFAISPGGKGRLQFEGGRRHYVCRSPKTGGYPRGFTNAFKLSANCGLADIAEVAQFTQGDWYWMTSPYGERLSRDQWLAMYGV